MAYITLDRLYAPIIVCSAWSTCNTNLQREGCTFYNLLVQMFNSADDSYEYDENKVQQNYKEPVQSLHHLCDNIEPGTNTRHSVSTA